MPVLQRVLVLCKLLRVIINFKVLLHFNLVTRYYSGFLKENRSTYYNLIISSFDQKKNLPINILIIYVMNIMTILTTYN